MSKVHNLLLLLHDDANDPAYTSFRCKQELLYAVGATLLFGGKLVALV